VSKNANHVREEEKMLQKIYKQKRSLVLVLATIFLLCTVALFTMPVHAAEGEGTAHKHCVCGATHTAVGNHENEDISEFTAINSESELNAISVAGRYYLTADIEFTGTFTPADGTVLCLNGKKLKSTNSSAITIGPDVTFTLVDCSDGDEGKVTSPNNAVYITGGTFNIYGGKIADSSAEVGAGIYATNGSEINMYGGEISGNKATYGEYDRVTSVTTGVASAVFAYQSTFNMYDGTITQNTSGGWTYYSDGGKEDYPDGGAAHVYAQYFNMYGGEISGNTIHQDGSVLGLTAAVKANNFKMTGGTISDSFCSAVQIGTGTVSGGMISSNAALTGRITFAIGFDQLLVGENEINELQISGGDFSASNSNGDSFAIVHCNFYSYDDYRFYEKEGGATGVVYLSGNPSISGGTADLQINAFVKHNTDDIIVDKYYFNGKDENSDVAYTESPLTFDTNYKRVSNVCDVNGQTAFFNVSDVSKIAPADNAKYSLEKVDETNNYKVVAQNVTVTYYDEDGTELSTDSVAYHGTLTSLPEAPQKEGKTFLGWVYKFEDDTVYSSKYFKTSMNVDGNLSLKAVYAIDFKETAGTTYYEISSAEELKSLSDIMSDRSSELNNANVEFRLTRHIDLSSVCGPGIGNWVPVNISNYQNFVFDGQGYSISGLYINDPTMEYASLFGRSAGTIKNLTLIAPYIVGGDYVGAFVGTNSGIIENCHVEKRWNNGSYEVGTITGNVFVGGIAGASSGYIYDCSNDATVSATGYSDIDKGEYKRGEFVGAVGGIVGMATYGHNYSNYMVKDSHNYGDVSGICTVGGIVGVAEFSYGYDVSIEDCTNEGTISGGVGVGGIAAVTFVDIKNCSNSGAVAVSQEKANEYLAKIPSAGGSLLVTETFEGLNIDQDAILGTGVGGIAGIAVCASIQNCQNTQAATIQGLGMTGGICGIASFETEIKNCTNEGTVEAGTCAGGIVGVTFGTIYNCSNFGTVSIAEWIAQMIVNLMSDPEVGAMVPVALEVRTTGSNSETLFYFYQGTPAGSCAGGISGMNVGSISQSENHGQVSSFAVAGGISAFALSSIYDCINMGSVATVEADTFDVSYMGLPIEGSIAGGIAGASTGAYIATCINVGDVSAEVESVYGIMALHGIMAFDLSTVDSEHFAPSDVKNNFYLADASDIEVGQVTQEQLASGEVAFMLAQHSDVWGQLLSDNNAIASDPIPTMGSPKVYYYMSSDTYGNSMVASVEEMEQIMQEIISKADSIEQAINNNAGEIANVAGDLSDLTTTVNTLKTNLAENYFTKAQVEAIETALKEADTAIKASIDALTAKLNTEVSRLDGLIFGNSTAIGENAEKIATNIADIAELTTSVSDIKANLAGNYLTKAQVEAIETALELADDEINEAIGALQTAVNTLTQDLNTAKGNIQTNTGNITANATNIATLTTNLNNLSGAVETLKTNLENADSVLQGKIDALDTAYKAADVEINEAITALESTLNTKVTALNGLISGNTTNISANAGKIATNIEDIAALKQTVATLATQAEVDTIKTTLENADKAINETIDALQKDLEDAIEELEASIATKADATALAEQTTKLSDLTTTVEDLSDAVDAKDLALKQELNQAIDSAKEALQDSIDALQDELDQKVNDLNALISDNATDIATNAGEIANVASDLSDLSTSVNTLKTNLEKADADLAQDIADLDKALTDADTAIKASITALEAKLDQKISELNALIEANKNGSEDNSAEITSLSAELTALTSTVTVLADDVSDDYATKDELTQLLNEAKASLQAAIELGDKQVKDELNGTIDSLIAEINKIKDLNEKQQSQITALFVAMVVVVALAVAGTVVAVVLNKKSKGKGGKGDDPQPPAEPSDNDSQQTVATQTQEQEKVEQPAEIVQAEQEPTEQQPVDDVAEQSQQENDEQPVEEVNEQQAEIVEEKQFDQVAEQTEEVEPVDENEQPVDEQTEQTEIDEQVYDANQQTEQDESVNSQLENCDIPEEDADDDHDVSKNDLSVIGIKSFRGYPRKSQTFEEKMSLADEQTKQNFNEIAQKFESFKKAKRRDSKKFVTFSKGRTRLARITMSGKTIKCYFALDPNEFATSKYHHKDAGDKSKYEKTPFMLRVKSGRSLKYAKQLIDELAKKHNL